MKYTIVCEGDEKKKEQEVEVRLKDNSGYIVVEARFIGTEFWSYIVSIGYGTENFTEFHTRALAKFGFKTKGMGGV